MFYLEGRGDDPPRLSTAAPVLCSQQPNRTDTLSPRVTPLWGVCVSSGSASGPPWCVGSVCVSVGGVKQVNVAQHPRFTWKIEGVIFNSPNVKIHVGLLSFYL